MANVRDDEQKPHTRLSLRASQPHMAKPTGSGDRVNAAFVHGKFTLLSGEICASRDREFMRKCRNRFTRLTKYPAYPPAVGGYESLLRETQSKQQHDLSCSALHGNMPGKHAEVSRRHSTSNWSEGRPERGKEDDTIMSSHTVMNPTGGAE